MKALYFVILVLTFIVSKKLVNSETRAISFVMITTKGSFNVLHIHYPEYWLAVFTVKEWKTWLKIILHCRYCTCVPCSAGEGSTEPGSEEKHGYFSRLWAYKCHRNRGWWEQTCYHCGNRHSRDHPCYPLVMIRKISVIPCHYYLHVSQLDNFTWSIVLFELWKLFVLS